MSLALNRNLLLPFPMADSLWMRLRKIPWEQYPCNPGTAKKAPKMLENLASRKGARAMKASHELWAALCAGQVAPAAEASISFLVEIIDISSSDVKPEILDILLKCAQVECVEGSPAFHARLHSAIRLEAPFLMKLTRSRDETTATKASMILELIQA